MKLEENSQAIEDAVRDRLASIPSVHIDSLRPDIQVGSNSRADLVCDLNVHGKPVRLLVECKREGNPQRVREGIAQLRYYLSHFKGQKVATYGILVAPFLSENAAKICNEAEVGYLDLAGNARLNFDGIFIERRVASKNPYRRQEYYSLFSPRATRVLRVLLTGPLRTWKVKELACAADVSIGWVSQVRKQLIAQEWATADAIGLRVTQPGAILDAWANKDQWKSRTEVRQYSLLSNDPQEIATAVHEVLGNSRHAFTQWFAGWLRHPYTIPAIVTAYVDEFPDEEILKAKLFARNVETGAQLRLIKPRDVGVFTPAQSVGGFALVSDVQIYVDLLNAGQRGDEQAAELRKWPDFAGGWS